MNKKSIPFVCFVFVSLFASSAWAQKPPKAQKLSPPKVTTLGEYDVESVWDLIYAPKSKRLYLSDPKAGDIRAIDLSSGTIYDVKGSFSRPYGLVADPNSEVIFYCDDGLVSINELNAGRSTPIIRGCKGKGIVFGPEYRSLYFISGSGSDDMSFYRIMHLDLASGEDIPSTLVRSDYLDEPLRIAIDREEEDLYWYDAGNNAIVRSNLKGEEMITIHHVRGMITGFVYDAEADLAYYVDGTAGNLVMIDRKTGRELIMLKNLNAPRGLAYDKDSQVLYTFEIPADMKDRKEPLWVSFKNGMSRFFAKDKAALPKPPKPRLLKIEL